jgi:hypothetical protein
LNWTPVTVRAPTIVTLALTATVPPTVDPEAGEVIVTISLPSCADAGRDEIQATAKANSAAAKAAFTPAARDPVVIGRPLLLQGAHRAGFAAVRPW